MLDRAKAEAFIDLIKTSVADPQSMDMDKIADMVADDPILYTPRFWRPITDKNWMTGILAMIPRAVENFTYFRHWIDGNDVIMEFKGNVGKFTLQGIDIFTLTDEGKIKELTVFVRPPNALAALGEVEDKMLLEMMGAATQDDFAAKSSA